LPRFRLESSRQVFSSKVFDVALERAAGPRGVEMEKHVVRHPGAVAVLAQDGKGRVLLIRQYRLPLRKALWELPAGTVEPGETPLRTARRELLEETGLRARRWRKLAAFYTTPGFCDERMTLYLAGDVREGEAAPEPYELIQKRWFGWDELEAMMSSGRLQDGKTLLALLYARHAGEDLSGRT